MIPIIHRTERKPQPATGRLEPCGVYTHLLKMRGREERGAARNDHRPAFRRKIDGHYSPVRSNSLPIFRGANGKRTGRIEGREGNRSLPVRNNLLVRCGSSYFSSLHPTLLPSILVRRSTLSTMFLMNNHLDV